MAVQFILGRSGSGKTTYCIETIVEALTESTDQQLILLVPEQATYQAERTILANKKIAGYNKKKDGKIQNVWNHRRPPSMFI